MRFKYAKNEILLYCRTYCDFDYDILFIQMCLTMGWNCIIYLIYQLCSLVFRFSFKAVLVSIIFWPRRRAKMKNDLGNHT